METKDNKINEETLDLNASGFSLSFLIRDLIAKKKREIKEYQNLVLYVKNDEKFVLKEIELMQQQVQKVENINVDNLEEVTYVLDEITQNDILKNWCLSVRFE